MHKSGYTDHHSGFSSGYDPFNMEEEIWREERKKEKGTAHKGYLLDEFGGKTLFIILGITCSKLLLWFFTAIAEQEGIDISGL